MNIDQETAKQLLATGAFLLLMDAPWQTGPRFKGLKLIPPGFHFIHYSSKSTSTGDTGVRTGFFKFFASKEIYVTQWNASEEDLMEQESLDKAQVERLKYNIMEFEPSLGAYPLIPHPQQPLPTFQKWLRLTNYITEPLLKSLLPSTKKVSSLVSVSRFSDLDESILPSGSKAVDSEGKQELVSLNIRFTPIDLKRSYPANATPDQVTKYFQDKSWLLNSVLKSFYDQVRFSYYKALLGELQFSFILFLVGQVYDGLEQWKCLTQLVCSSEEALSSPLSSTLFYEFLGTLHSQLEECPEDFFVDALSSSNFLRSAIVDLVCNVRDPDAVNRLPNVKLEQRVTKFVELVTERFKWDLEEAVQERWAAQDIEEGEFAPMVVEDE
ncbi:AAR2-domain-containing protein [Rhizoclosmatium globosum]|uniref:AAR2-domain-containing protein n=1 Tax=Rhizoclosmatium globosum TaxID=329046 RepID=A0A1Y2D178_9FUNG|nr:AAR2-domain-containing protein [Rhizoclosmatium globosum]|eukprot:ORY53022.1 AAR2-domain-containing protein [Rhizoclosmatium globosum]